MRLEGVEVRWVDLRLRRPVATAAGAHLSRPVVLVRVCTEAAEGWGECGAMAAATPVDPGVDRMWTELCRAGAPRLWRASRARGGHLPEASRVTTLFGTSGPQRMAAAALEMAVLDAELRAAGESLVARFAQEGVPPGPCRVPVGAVLGIPDDRRETSLVAAVDRLAEQGYARVRLKIEPGWDLAPIRAVRQRHPALPLQVDANGSYRLGSPGADAAERLVILDELALTCLEQPLPPADLPGHARLAELLATPICLDESLSSPRRVADAIRYGACEVACLKPARLGGLACARTALDRCRSAGIGAFVGGFFESGLGRSANAALACLPGFTLPGDLSSPADYLTDDPFSYPAVEDGAVVVGREPGVAPAPDPVALLRLTARRAWFGPEDPAAAHSA